MVLETKSESSTFEVISHNIFDQGNESESELDDDVIDKNYEITKEVKGDFYRATSELEDDVDEQNNGS